MEDVGVEAIREKMGALGVSYAQASELYLKEKNMLDGVVPPTQPKYEEPDELRAEFEGIGDVNSEEKGSGARYNVGKPSYEYLNLENLIDVIECDYDFATQSQLWALEVLCRLAQFQRRELDASEMLVALCDLSDMEASTYVWQYGAQKYAAWNWAKGMAWSVPIGCIIRHAIAVLQGEEIDPESGQTHIGHISCNLQMLAHFQKYYTQGDDRPPRVVFEHA